MDEKTSLVPNHLGQIFEWADYPVLCNVSTGDPYDDCREPAKYLVRAEDHNCRHHDKRFRFVCQHHLDRYVAKGGFAFCFFLDHRPKVALVEVRDYAP